MMILIPPCPGFSRTSPYPAASLPVGIPFCRCPVIPLSSFSLLTWFVLRCLLAELTLTQASSRSPTGFQSFPGWFPLTRHPPCENVLRHPAWRASFLPLPWCCRPDPERYFAIYLPLFAKSASPPWLSLCCILNAQVLTTYLLTLHTSSQV